MFRRLTAIVALLTGLSSAAVADDWPQWRGPNRDGVSAETELLVNWPAVGPPLAWRVETLGSGYSGPAVVGARLFVMGSDGASEFVCALAVETGKEAWRTALGPVFKNPWGDGPRGTPTVSGGRVYALGAQGVLACVEAATGNLVWKTDLRADHGGRLMRGNFLGLDWGYAESPLVDGGRVVVSPGGPGGTVAAFDAATGELLWRTKAVVDAASYASAVVATVAGSQQYVQLTGGVEYADGVLMKAPPRAVGLDPATGALLWGHPIRYATAGVINTPVVLGDRVTTSCGYGAGCTILRVARWGTRLVAIDETSADARRAMKTYHGGVVPAGDRVYGYSETGGWVCQSFPKGDEIWADQKTIAGGAHVRVGSGFYFVTTAGRVAAADPGNAGWVPRGDFALPGVSPSRKANAKIQVCTHPVVANGRLYVRDMETLYCYDLRPAK